MENTPAYKKPILAYINYFRAFAIIVIVLGHTIIWGKPDGLIKGFHQYVFTGGTILFVFIAGYLFEYLAYKFEYKKYLINKLKNVIMPYFITLLPATIIFSFFIPNVKHYLYQYPPIVRFIAGMLHGVAINEVLWFIPMISIFYLASPLLLYLKKKKIVWIILILLSLYMTLFWGRIHISEYMSARKMADVGLCHWGYLLVKSYLYRFLYFFSVYALGMSTSDFIENNYEKVKQHAKKVVCWGFTVYALLFIVFVPLLHLPRTKMNFGRLILVYVALCFFILVQDYITKHKILDKTLNLLADYSFGIFFIHMYIFYMINCGTIYRKPKFPEIAELFAQDSFQAFAHSWYCFFVVLGGSVLILYVLNWILVKMGVKNPRMFIGVGRSSSKQVQNK